MQVLGILKYECSDTKAILSRLPKKEEERLRGKAENYILGSAMGRLLLFSLLRELFGEELSEPEVAYRERGDMKGGGAPYLVGRPELSISISHTDGACAVLISDEEACGVDIESLTAAQSLSGEKVRRISDRFYLNDFQTKKEKKHDGLKIIIYIYDDKNGILKEKEKIKAVKESIDTNDVKEKMIILYTRMEALAKASGIGVSFLPEREKHLSKSVLLNFCYDSFWIGVAFLG